MAKKRRTRELAMQVIYLWDSNGQQDLDLARQLLADAREDDAVRDSALKAATAAWDQLPITDPWLERLAPKWPLKRQPSVDRNILRLAVWELTATNTPPRVVIDEAIEMAKHFSTEQSAAFVNGVLDAVLKEKTALTSETPPKTPEPQ